MTKASLCISFYRSSRAPGYSSRNQHEFLILAISIPFTLSSLLFLTLRVCASQNGLVQSDEVDSIRSTEFEHSLLYETTALVLWAEICSEGSNEKRESGTEAKEDRSRKETCLTLEVRKSFESLRLQKGHITQFFRHCDMRSLMRREEQMSKDKRRFLSAFSSYR